jgi:hypothetical protein
VNIGVEVLQATEMRCSMIVKETTRKIDGKETKGLEIFIAKEPYETEKCFMYCSSGGNKPTSVTHKGSNVEVGVNALVRKAKAKKAQAKAEENSD